MVKILILFASLIFIGCFHSTGTGEYGRDFPIERASELKKGETTKQRVRVMFGLPFTTTVADSGETWTYSYSKSKINMQGIGFASSSSINVNTKMLTVVFGSNGLVRSFATSHTE